MRVRRMKSGSTKILLIRCTESFITYILFGVLHFVAPLAKLKNSKLRSSLLLVNDKFDAVQVIYSVYSLIILQSLNALY